MKFLWIFLSAIVLAFPSKIAFASSERLIHRDSFDGQNLGALNPFWTPRGQNVVLGDPAGWVSLRADATDVYTRIEANSIPPSHALRLRFRHNLQPGPNVFLPAVGFSLSNGDGFAMLWARSWFRPDYCDQTGGFDKVVFRGPLGQCVVSQIASSSLYNLDITSELIVDARTGRVQYDVHADGIIDFEHQFSVPAGVFIQAFRLVGYGWFTGHRMNVDWIEVFSVPTSAQPQNVVSDISTLQFGTQTVGTQTGTRVIMLTNTGNVAEAFGSIDVTSSPSGVFLLDSSACTSRPLDAGNACALRVRFSPNGAGNAVGSVNITMIGSAQSIRVDLEGAGVTSPASAVAPRLQSISPMAGPPGTRITLAGRSFGGSVGTSFVQFATFGSAVRAQVVSWIDNQIVVMAPSGLVNQATVTVHTDAGISTNVRYRFTNESTCAVVVDTNNMPQIKSRLDFLTLFRGITDAPQKFALKDVSAAQFRYAINPSLVPIGGTPIAPALEDKCYISSMHAVEMAQGSQLLSMGLRGLASGIVSAGIGSIPADSAFNKLLIGSARDFAGAVVQGDGAIDALASSLARETTKYVLTKEVRNVFVENLTSSIVDFNAGEVVNLLSREGVLKWSLSGSTEGSASFNLPPATIVARASYHPFSRYIHLTVNSTCRPPASPQTKKTYSMRFEIERHEVINNSARMVPGTLSAAEVRPQSGACNR